MTRFPSFGAALLLGIALSTVVDAQRGPARDITNVTGDLYRARNGAWATIFYVTPGGIILGDPINTAFSTWLKEQLAQRFKVPVRYVVYSHSHFDHAEGGAVFADTATFVAHENMLRNMDGRYPHMPGDMLDRNDNGVIDPDEIDVPTKTRPGVCGWGPGFFTTWDHDKDGKVAPAELQRDIRRPDIVYSERMRLALGGRVVDLVHPGLNHSDDATVMYFPAERVVFATEFLADALVTTNIRSLPSACGPYDGNPLSEWIKSYRAVEALDFDILAAGHGTGLFTQGRRGHDAGVLRGSDCRRHGRHQAGEESRGAGENDAAREVQGLGAIRTPSRLQHQVGVPEPEGVSAGVRMKV